MTTDLLTLTGRDGAILLLLAAQQVEGGLEAEGWIVEAQLRAGRVFTAPDGRKYRLSAGLKPGVRWDARIELTTA